MVEGATVIAVICLAILIGWRLTAKGHFATGTIRVAGQGCHTLVHAGDRFSSQSGGKIYKAVSDTPVASYGCGKGPTNFNIVATMVRVKAEKAGSQYNADAGPTYYDTDASNQISGEGLAMSGGN